MTRGRELPLNSKVRRRLFSEDTPDKTGSGGNENDHPGGMTKQQNAVQKLYNETAIKGMKWNFDFKNETAMDGRIKWYKKTNTDEWVGMQPTDRNCIRDMDETEYESGNASERSQERRHANVLKRLSLFADSLPLDFAIIEGEQDNLINESISEFPSLRYGCMHWNFHDNTGRVPILWCGPGESCEEDVLGLENILYGPQQNEFEQLPAEASSPQASELGPTSTTSRLDSDENKVTNDIDMDKLCATELKPNNDKTEADVNNVSNNVATENDNMSEEMKIDKIIEHVKDGNQNDDENLPKKHFENLKISENTKDKENVVEEVTDMKDKNEATPSTSSNDPLHPKRTAQTQLRNENVKRKRLLPLFE